MCSCLLKLFLFSALCICCSSLCRLAASWSSPVHPGMSVVPLVQLEFRESCCWLLMDMISDVTKKHNDTTYSLILFLTSFQLLFSNVSWILSRGVDFLDISFGPGIHNFTFWLVVVFCIGRVFCSTNPFPNNHSDLILIIDASPID